MTCFVLYADLRQDMLSLQMLRIMDNLWQAEGLDLRYVLVSLSGFLCFCSGVVFAVVNFAVLLSGAT